MSETNGANQPQDTLLQGLPAHVEAERAVLGSVFLDPGSMNLALEHVKSEHFYRETHQVIFEALCELYAESEPLEPMAVAEKLRINGHLEKVGGIPYLASLLEAVTSTSSVEHYSKMIREKSIARSLITSP